MRMSRWTNPEIPLEILALKLCEEAAEVGTELTDLYVETTLEDEQDEITAKLVRYRRAASELQQVEFIAKTLHDRLTEEIRRAMLRFV